MHICIIYWGKVVKLQLRRWWCNGGDITSWVRIRYKALIFCSNSYKTADMYITRFSWRFHDPLPIEIPIAQWECFSTINCRMESKQGIISKFIPMAMQRQKTDHTHCWRITLLRYFIGLDLKLLNKSDINSRIFGIILMQIRPLELQCQRRHFQCDRQRYQFVWR